MSPSRRQIKPNRVIAEFSAKNNPLFLVERGAVPGRDQSEDSLAFVFRDADEALPQRVIAAGELEQVDAEARHAKLQLEVDPSSPEENYALLPCDIRGGLCAILRHAGLEKVTVTETNLSSEQLERVGCAAVDGQVEFSLPLAA